MNIIYRHRHLFMSQNRQNQPLAVASQSTPSSNKIITNANPYINTRDMASVSGLCSKAQCKRAWHEEEEDDFATIAANKMEDAATVGTAESSFSEYVKPPHPPAKLPPPKYKAWLVLYFSVYMTNWAIGVSGFIPWIQNELLLSANTALFFQLFLLVWVLLYAGTDVIVFLLRVKINGEWYGLGRWMENPARVGWVHKHKKNLPMELLGILITVLEDGFSMFNAPPTKADGRTKSTYESSNPHLQTVLKIEYKIRNDALDDYKAWRKDLYRAMDIPTRPGLLFIDHATVEASDTSTLQRIYLTFATVDDLNSYIASPIRERLMRRLRPLLHYSDISHSIHQQHNALVDLAGQQGQLEPPRPAPKWKVFVIIMIALFSTVLLFNETSPWYWEQWGLDAAPPAAQRAVDNAVTTFVSFYMATPLLTMVFSHWMVKECDERETQHEPWRTLNEGFSSIWAKIVVVVVFYGSCVASAVLQRVASRGG